MAIANRPLTLCVTAVLLAAGCDDDKSTDSDVVLDGVVTVETDDGLQRTTYVDGVKQGEFVWFREDGGEYQRGTYVDDMKTGVWSYDDIVIRFETHYSAGERCGEERKSTHDGDSLVLRESFFYVDDERVARGEWQCEDGDCSRWNGIWYEIGEDGAVFKRTYENGVATGSEIVRAPSPCHSMVF